MIATILKRRHFLILALIGIISLSSCTKVDASGDQIFKRYEVADFDKISYELGGELTYTQGSETQVSVNTTLDAFKGIDVFVKDQTLYIKRKKGYKIVNQDDLRFEVIDDDTYDIYVCGAGDVTADFDESYSFKEHFLSVSGSGSITADVVNGDYNKALTSGSGNITIQSLNVTNSVSKINGSGSVIYGSGIVANAEVNIHGSGDYHSYDLWTTETIIFNSGSGTGFLRAQSRLDADVNGSGSVYFKGQPVVSQSISGTGDVIDAN